MIDWSEPADTSKVTHYDVYIVEAVYGFLGCNGTNETAVAALVAVITGSLSFAMDGATAAQVEAAVKAALVESLGISLARFS